MKGAEKLAREEKQRANEEAAIAEAVNNFIQNDILWQASTKRQADDKPWPPGRRGKAPHFPFERAGPPVDDERDSPAQGIDRVGKHTHPVVVPGDGSSVPKAVPAN